MTAGQHSRQEAVGEVGDRHHVEPQHLFDPLAVGLFNFADDGKSGVIDKQLDGDAPLGNLVEQSRRLARVRKVAGDDFAIGAVPRVQFGGKFVEAIGPASSQNQMHAAGSEQAGEFGTDPR